MGVFVGSSRQSGSIALVLMLGAFLLALGGGAWFFLAPGEPGAADREARAARAVYDEAVANLERAMGDPRSVDASIGRNAAFQCLFSQDGNCSGRGGPFLFFESATNNRPLSQLARDAGWDIAGAACRGFPSPACPVRVETVWDPVCNGRCEGTNSFRVRARVSLAPAAPGAAPLEWAKESMFTPAIQLSQSVQCARGGGEWTGRECLTPGQAAERRLASPPQPGAAPDPRDAAAEAPAEAPQPVEPQVIAECPNQIVVQGQYYAVQFVSADRGQVSVPAMGCPLPGMFDVFVFQCAAKPNPGFPNEGHWIQVEAVMSPPCNPDGTQIPQGGKLPLRF